MPCGDRGGGTGAEGAPEPAGGGAPAWGRAYVHVQLMHLVARQTLAQHCKAHTL